MAETGEILVGVVGCGRCPMFGHLPALSKLGGRFRVVAVCDVDKSRRERAEKIVPGVRHYRRVEDMAECRDIRVALVATPSPDHEAHVRACLGRGLFTVCETPVAMSSAGADALNRLLRKTGGKLLPSVPALFSDEFRLACEARKRKELGAVYGIRIKRSTYERRKDWQSTLKRGGGATHYAAQEPLLQAMLLLGAQPAKVWTETKKVVSQGDAEDYVRVLMQTAEGVTAEVEIDPAYLGPPEPSIAIRGTRGTFAVYPGESSAKIRCVDPAQKLPRLRACVTQAPLEGDREEIRIVEEEVRAENPMPQYEAFWLAVHDAFTGKKQFPVDFGHVAELSRFAETLRKTAPAAI